MSEEEGKRVRSIEITIDNSAPGPTEFGCLSCQQHKREQVCRTSSVL